MFVDGSNKERLNETRVGLQNELKPFVMWSEKQAQDGKKKQMIRGFRTFHVFELLLYLSFL